MGRFFWIIMGLIGLALIALIASGDTGKVLGFETSQFAALAVMSLWALIIGAGVFGYSGNFSTMLKQIVAWIVIILALMTFYVFRYDLQDFASRLTGGIIEGSPIARTNDNGKEEVTLIRSRNGHFEARAGVNNKSVLFLVDTGASAIVLAAKDAENAGIDVSKLSFDIPTRTANGTGYSAITKIDSLYLGGIERKNIRVMIAEPGRLHQSLLGQDFLESLSSYEKRGDRLILRD